MQAPVACQKCPCPICHLFIITTYKNLKNFSVILAYPLTNIYLWWPLMGWCRFVSKSKNLFLSTDIHSCRSRTWIRGDQWLHGTITQIIIWRTNYVLIQCAGCFFHLQINVLWDFSTTQFLGMDVVSMLLAKKIPYLLIWSTPKYQET